MMVETIGFAATLFVLVSFLFEEQRITRLVNIIGAALFVVYGLMLGAISVWLLNAILIVIHIKFLKKGAREDDYYLYYDK